MFHENIMQIAFGLRLIRLSLDRVKRHFGNAIILDLYTKFVIKQSNTLHHVDLKKDITCSNHKSIYKVMFSYI